jgi:hypothetical protein
VATGEVCYSQLPLRLRSLEFGFFLSSSVSVPPLYLSPLPILGLIVSQMPENIPEA